VPSENVRAFGTAVACGVCVLAAELYNLEMVESYDKKLK
jgi:hypothetical protein